MFDEDKNDSLKYRYDVKLTDIETKKVFYDKLTFIYLEMPKFNKTIDEIETRFEKWLYLLRNLFRLERVPDKLREQILKKVFETAEIARFTQGQVRSYEESLNVLRDIKNSIDTARDEGGINKALEIAKKALKKGMSIEDIIDLTGLTPQEIEHLQ